jgi:7-keto-8-aminopelargonate synthetase-like enzyme
MTEAEPLQQTNRTYVVYRGRRLSYFGGCDYFRLGSHPKILKAVGEGLRRYGLNVAASRVTTGNHELYPALEGDLARFFGSESALLATTGYITNLVVAQALAGQFSHALMDERAHAALHDAAQLLNCPVLTFKHRDPESFATTLQRCGRAARPIVLTDGMFSRDGSIAPLRAYLKLLPRDGLLMVDDAHGAGTLGKTGKGSVELAGIPRNRLIQNITLSKAFGVYGGAILCSRKLREKLVSSRLFAGSTPIPLPLAFAARQAVQLVRQDRSLRPRLETNAAFVKFALRKQGFDLPDAPGPIISLHLADPKNISRLKRALLAAGVFPSFINYHSNPGNGYFRFVICSEHSREQLASLVAAIKPFGTS